MRKTKLILTAALFSLYYAAFPFAFEAFEPPEDEKVHFLNAGLDLYRFEETSSGFVDQKDKGNFAGIFLKYTSLKPFGWLSSGTDNFFTLEARYAQSNDIKR